MSSQSRRKAISRTPNSSRAPARVRARLAFELRAQLLKQFGGKPD